MPSKLLLALVGLLLTACAATSPSKLAGPACPSLPEYDRETRNKAADEIEAMPPGSVIADIFMVDYAAMRAGVRACHAAQTAGGVAP